MTQCVIHICILNKIKNTRQPFFLDAHADMIGFMCKPSSQMVQFAFYHLVDGIKKNIVSGEVWILNDKGEKISGIVANQPVHFLIGNKAMESRF